MANSTDTALETIGQAIKTNGNGGILEGITAAIAANGGGGTLQGIADAISNLNCGGGNAVLTATRDGFPAKKLTLTGAMQYNTPLYVNDDAYAIFDLRNNYAGEPIMLSIAGQDIPLKIKLISNGDMPALYRDLNDCSGFSLLFGKDKDGKTVAYFLGSAVPPAFYPIAKLNLEVMDYFDAGVKFDLRYHHYNYTKTLFINNPQLLTAENPTLTIATDLGHQMMVCYDWNQPLPNTQAGFATVHINEFTGKYRLLRADLVDGGKAFITPLSAAAK